MLRRRALLKKTMDWDYEWYASAGIPPIDKDGKIPSGHWKTDGEDWQIGLWELTATNYNFAESAPILVEMVISADVINYTYPQACFCYAEQCGFKLMYTTSGIKSTITGPTTMVDATHIPQNLARITVQVSADGCYLTFNNVKQNGPGVIDSSSCPRTRLSAGDVRVFMKELRYKYL